MAILKQRSLQIDSIDVWSSEWVGLKSSDTSLEKARGGHKQRRGV